MILWLCGVIAGVFIYGCAQSGFEDEAGGWKPLAITVGIVAIIACAWASTP
jgi:hypothetical protein